MKEPRSWGKVAGFVLRVLSWAGASLRNPATFSSFAGSPQETSGVVEGSKVLVP
jgi:hypothetical protein